MGLIHLYVLYAVLWYVAGWKAAWRAARGKNGWAKTERTVENQEQVDSSADALTAEAHA